MRMYGFTEQDRVGRYMIFTHAGNQGATLNDVRKDLDHLNGVGFYDALIYGALALGLKATGAPDYCWQLKVPYTLHAAAADQAYL